MSRVLRRLLPAASLIGLPGIILLALYWPVLNLPYFWDDFPHFNFATTRSFLGLWTNATGLPYYRPLTSTINKLFFDNLPFGATFWPHLCLVLGHLLACALAGYVAGVMFEGPGQPVTDHQRWARLAVATTAAALFAVYPFAMLTVSCYSCATHVWLVDLTLAGLAALLAAARLGGRVFALFALVAALLAPTAHEAGVMAGTIMVAGLWIYDRGYTLRHWRLSLAVAALSALFLPIWAVVPKSRDSNAPALALGGAAELLAKLSFFLQSPSYPVQPLAALLISRQKWWDLGAVWLCGLPPLAIVGWWLWRHGRGRVVAFAAAWTALAMLPTVAALHFDYIITSQRLLYITGPAAAVLWAVVIVELARAGNHRGTRLAGLAGAAVLAVAALGVPTAYAVRQARLNALALSPLQQLDVAARQYPHDRFLIVNTVNWLSYRQIWYPLGHDGVAVLAPYLGLPDLIYINTGARVQATIATFPDLLPAFTSHYLSTANEGPGQLWDTSTFTAHIIGVDHTWMTTYTDEAATVRDVGHVTPGPATVPAGYLARFGQSVYLLAGSLRADGPALDVTLDWLYLGPDPQATIFRNAFDCAGNVVGLGSGHALGTMLPFGGLPAGTRVHDLRAIPLTARSPDGCYQVEVGLFRADGSRVDAFGQDGKPLDDQLVLIRQ